MYARETYPQPISFIRFISLFLLPLMVLGVGVGEAAQVGRSVSIDDQSALVAEYDAARGAAVARFYTRDVKAGAWRPAEVILERNRPEPGELGFSVVLDGSRAFVAVPGEAAYVYERSADELGASEQVWRETGVLVPGDFSDRATFGLSVQLIGENVAVTSKENVYLYAPSRSSWDEIERIPAGNEGGYRLLELDPTGALRKMADAGEAMLAAPQGKAAADTFFVVASDNIYEPYTEVRWPASSSLTALFKIYRGPDLLTFASSFDTLYQDTGGALATVYNYCVVELDGGTQVVTDSLCDLGSRSLFLPQDVSATDGDFEDRIRVSWEDFSTIEAGFYIFRDLQLIDSVETNQSIYLDTSAVPGVTYDYCVMPFDSNGGVNGSTCDEGTRAYILPPLKVQASDGQYPDSVLITWEDQTDLESEYNIYRDGVWIASVEAEKIGEAPERFVDLTATYSFVHEYCVETVRHSDGQVSTQVCDFGGRDVLAAPTDVSATDSEFDDHIEITWVPGSQAHDWFWVYRKGTRIDSVGGATTSYSDFGAQPGETHIYCVNAYSSGGGASPPLCDAGRQSEILAPINVNASDDEFEDRVLLTWETTSTTTALFKLHRDGALIATVPYDARGFADLDVSSGTTHRYCVVAVTALGIESDSTCDSSGSRLLLAPTNVQATDDEFERETRITWEDNSSVEKSYEIHRSTASLPPQLIGTRNANRTAYVDDTGEPGVTYDYHVRVFDGSYWSANASDTGSRRLKTPTNLEASQGGYEDQIVLNWADSSGVESGYRVYRELFVEPQALQSGSGGEGRPDRNYMGKGGAAVPALIGSTGTNGFTFTDNTVVFGLSYTYEVVAFDALGESEAISGDGFTMILPPGSFNASDNYGDKIVLTWTDDSIVETNYRIYRDGVLLATSPASATSYVDNAAINDVAYTYTAYAISGSDSSGAANDDGISPSPVTAVANLVPILERLDPRIEENDLQHALFGTSVAIDGNYLVSGAPGQDSRVGTARLYEKSGDDWTFNTSLDSDRPESQVGGAWFGFDVDIAGNFIAIGAPSTRFDDPGWVYLFKEDNTHWEVHQELLDAQGDDGDRFGHSVALDEERLLVGAPGNGQGIVYSYAYRGASGDYEPIEMLSSGVGGFGEFVALSGEHALIVAADTGFAPGAVYFYDLENDDTWTETHTISGSGLGYAAVIDSNTAAFSTALGPNPQVFIYQLGEGGWVLAETLDPPPNAPSFFGSSLALQGDLLVVGARGLVDTSGAESGASYLYNRSNKTWRFVKGFESDAPENGAQFGAATAIDGGTLAIGARQESRATPDTTHSQSGHVYVLELLAPPSTVAATDGTLETQVKVTWADQSPNEDGFNVYRDGVLLEATGANIRSYSDFDAIPGKTYEYGVASYSSDLGESPVASDYGRRPADGNITGRVTTLAGSGVEDVEICLDPSPNAALLLDGESGHVRVDCPTMPMTAFTVEFWMKSSDLSKAGTPFSYAGSATNDNAILFSNHNGLSLHVNGNEVTSTASSTAGDWVHIAGTWRSSDGQAQIFQDGTLVNTAMGIAIGETIPQGGILVFGQDQDFPGGGFQLSQAFLGAMDEVKVWDHVLTTVEIQDGMTRKLLGDELGLVHYWPFDQGEGRILDDLAINPNYALVNGGGFWTNEGAPIELCAITDEEANYAFSGIRYGAETTLKVVPSYGSHVFAPAFKSITLSTENPVQNEVAFNDVTSFTVSGEIELAGTDCAVLNVEIHVDGVLRATTKQDGTYSFSFDGGTDVLIVPVLGSHTFDPPQYELDIQGNLLNVDFADTKLRSVSGRVGGGSGDCNKSIGKVVIEVFSQGAGCLTLLDTLDSDIASYELVLPAQAYAVEVIDVFDVPASLDRVDILESFERIGSREIDLTDSSAVLDFVYRAPLRIVLAGLPTPPDCDELNGAYVVDQLSSNPINIELYEDYGAGGLCPVDRANISVFDELAAVDTLIELLDGLALYNKGVTEINIFAGRVDQQGNDRSYQLPITVIADVEGAVQVSKTVWFLVEGYRTRTGTFVTGETDPLSLYVLRDPPGDASFATLEKGTTVCNTFTDLEMVGGGAGLEAKIDIGFRFQKGLGFATTTRAQQKFKLEFEAGRDNTDVQAWTTCVTTTETYSTSGAPEFVGGPADIYIGAAQNLLFAKNDIVAFNNSSCTVSKTVGISMDSDGESAFSTFFAFTDDHVANYLIPQLQELRDTLAIQNPSLVAEGQDFYSLSIENWESIRAGNQLSKNSGVLDHNRSFAAGADYEFSQDFSQDTTRSETTNIYFDTQFGIGFEMGESGNLNDFLFFGKTRYQDTNTYDTTRTSTRSISYTLSDGDLGDFFSVDVLTPEVPSAATDEQTFKFSAGGPIFKVVSGRSSCPWEPWYDDMGNATTQPRDGAILQITPRVQSMVPRDEPAVFQLSLTNDSQSGDLREYMLILDQPSNPGGAVVKINGSPASNGIRFFLDPNQTIEATLTVERGPSRFRYDDLELWMVPTCEFERFRNNLPLQLEDIETFSVDFEAPCSDIALFEPEDNWSFNENDGDSLRVTLIDFELAVSARDSLFLQQVGAEYRLAGTDDTWRSIQRAGVAQIDTNPDGSPQSVPFSWNVADIADGAYEIRAWTQCENVAGKNYSLNTTGRIDRTSPVVFGTPEPADSLLSMGDNIAISFNEGIDCQSIDEGDITLTIVPGDTLVPIQTTCDGTTIIIAPDVATKSQAALSLEGRTLQVRVSGVDDLAGNVMVDVDGSSEATWEFEYRQSSFTWAQTSIVSDVSFRFPGEARAELVNGGAEDVNFTLTDLPTWLDPTPLSGLLRAGETVEIVFAVPDDVAEGTYTAVVKADDVSTKGDGNEAVVASLSSDMEAAKNAMVITPLNVRVDVACRPPEWETNPAQYQFDMTVVADLMIPDRTVDPLDRIAAFVGGQVRGYAQPMVQGGSGGFGMLVFMNVYSNRSSGETIRFEVWDESECRWYPATDMTVRFENDFAYGTTDEPIEISALLTSSSGTTQMVDLDAGWNWFSLNLDGTLGMGLDDVFGNLNLTAGDLIKSRDEFSQFTDDDVFGDASWLGTLGDIAVTQMYQIRLGDPGTIQHEGSPTAVGTEIPIDAGWNWIGFIPQSPAPLAAALGDYDPSGGDIIKSQDAFAQYKQGGGQGWYGSLAELAPGQGYKLFSADGGDFSFSSKAKLGPLADAAAEGADGTSGAPASTVTASTKNEALHSIDWEVDARQFQHNMTMTVTFEFEGDRTPSDFDRVGAFEGDELRGVGRPEFVPGLNQWVSYLMVHGNGEEDEALTFRYFDESLNSAHRVVEQMTFRPDDVHGDIGTPFTLKVLEESIDTDNTAPDSGIPAVYALDRNVPNPFNPATMIRYSVPKDSQVKLKIYDVAGREVMTLVDEKKPAGRYEETFKFDDLASGVYFYKMTAGDFNEVRKMTLIK